MIMYCQGYKQGQCRVHLDEGQTLGMSMGSTRLWDLAGVDSKQTKTIRVILLT